jgi:hypothetical protein
MALEAPWNPTAAPAAARDGWLRGVLRGNAAFSTACGAAALAAPGRLAAALGVPEAGWLLAALGVGLLAFAAAVLALAARRPIPLAGARTVIAADLAWIAGTIPLVLWGPLSTAGVWIAIAVAALVAGFAEAQALGVRRARRAALAAR